MSFRAYAKEYILMNLNIFIATRQTAYVKKKHMRKQSFLWQLFFLCFTTFSNELTNILACRDKCKCRQLEDVETYIFHLIEVDIDQHERRFLSIIHE